MSSMKTFEENLIEWHNQAHFPIANTRHSDFFLISGHGSETK